MKLVGHNPTPWCGRSRSRAAHAIRSISGVAITRELPTRKRPARRALVPLAVLDARHGIHPTIQNLRGQPADQALLALGQAT
jgi:hypothetical protein